MKFRAVVELGGKTATGIPIPDDVVAMLGTGKRPAVRGGSAATSTAQRSRRWAAASSCR